MSIESRKSYKSLCDNERKIINGLLCDMYDLEHNSIDMFTKRLFDFHYSINLLKEQNKLLAFCIYKRDYRSHMGEIFHIDTLCVTEKGKGYGLKLLDIFKGCNLQLECKIDNENAQIFYEKIGLEKRAFSYIGKNTNIYFSL